MSEHDDNICPKCGKYMQSVTCSACGGDGEVGILMFKRPCSVCGQSGKVKRCPDEFEYSHIAGRWTTCSHCGGKAWYVPCAYCHGRGKLPSSVTTRPWTEKDLRRNPFLPYYAKPQVQIATTGKTCPSCRGNKGTVICLNCRKKNFKAKLHRLKGLTRRQPSHRCRLCGAQMKTHVCLHPGGNPKTCSLCHGKGEYDLCPNWRLHLKRRLPKTSTQAQKPLKQNFGKTNYQLQKPFALSSGKRRICTNCINGTYYPYPGLPYGVRCPICGGTGYLET